MARNRQKEGKESVERNVERTWEEKEEAQRGTRERRVLCIISYVELPPVARDGRQEGR